MENNGDSTILDYDSLAQGLRDLEAVCDAAECHGMVCGQLCRGASISAAELLEQILGRTAGDDRIRMAQAARLLESMLMNTAEALRSEDFSFEPLLPDAAQALSQRAMALGQWCDGFLFGFALGGELREDSLSNEALEGLRDLRDFTRIDVDGLMDEADESAYMEVMEYLRMVAMMLFQELQARAVAETKAVE